MGDRRRVSDVSCWERGLRAVRCLVHAPRRKGGAAARGAVLRWRARAGPPPAPAARPRPGRDARLGPITDRPESGIERARDWMRGMRRQDNWRTAGLADN